jgi:tRNA-modifying protein YgfZ
MMWWCPQVKLANFGHLILLFYIFMDLMIAPQSYLPDSSPDHRGLPHLRAIAFTGLEARAFLQTQLSSDVSALSPERPQFTTWCKPSGRALTLGWLFDAGDRLVWFVPAENAALVVQQLSIYKLRAKAQIALLPEQVLDAGEFKLLDGRSLGLSTSVIALSDASEAWILADITNLWPTLGGNERFLPQMLGVEKLGGLSLKKGCFPGQEVIARVHYKGEVKRSLARYLETEDTEPCEQSDFDLVQSARDAGHQLHILAVVKKPAPEQLRLEIDGKLHALLLAMP